MQYTYIDITSKSIVILRDFTTNTIYISFSIACVMRDHISFSIACVMRGHRNTISNISFLLDALDVACVMRGHISFSIACVMRGHRNTISNISFLLDALDVEDIIVTFSTSFIIYRYISLGLVRLPYTKAVRRSSA